MAAPEWLAYFTAAKSALDIIKGIRSELPKSPEADRAQQKIADAELALETSKAQLAKHLGFRLCQCSFPPPIMLLRASEKAYFCSKCDNRFPPVLPPSNDEEDDWIKARW
jgi:hypothetical protein